MGFFSAIARFFRTIFGLAEGGTQRATDNLLTSSPDTIRNQFRKTREDSVRDYNQMKDAIAELLVIHDQRAAQIQDLYKTLAQLEAKMNGAIELFKKNGDAALRTKYGQLAEEHGKVEAKIEEFEKEVAQQEQVIDQYKFKLGKLQTSIEALKQEEAETVADIVSSRKINELNSKLQGLTDDVQTKNLEAIRQARLKAKSEAKLSTDLSGEKEERLDEKLLTAGAASKHLDAFDAAVKLDKLLPPSKEIDPIKALDAIDAQFTVKTDKKDVKELEELFNSKN